MSIHTISANTAIDKRRDSRVRLAMWSAVAILALITVVAVFVPEISPRLKTVLTATAIAVLVLGVIAGYVIAGQDGLRRAKRQSEYELSATELIRRRSGWPDVRIALNTIDSLYRRGPWLVVGISTTNTKLPIPVEVEGYRTLEETLNRYCPISSPPKAMTVSTLGSLILTLIFFGAFGVALMTTRHVYVLGAGLTALAIMAIQSIRLGKALQQHPKRLLLWAFFVVSWASAVFLVLQRALRLGS